MVHHLPQKLSNIKKEREKTRKILWIWTGIIIMDSWLLRGERSKVHVHTPYISLLTAEGPRSRGSPGAKRAYVEPNLVTTIPKVIRIQAPERNGSFQAQNRKCMINKEHLTVQKNGWYVIRTCQLKGTPHLLSMYNLSTKIVHFKTVFKNRNPWLQ